MNIISEVLLKKRRNSQCALIPFLTAGYPSIELTVKALVELDKRGADIIELGIPYSDALADGPLIQYASKVALDKGTYIDQVFFILKLVSNQISVPIVIFTYYNPILVYGLHKFIQKIAKLGVKGLIIPDLPIEETNYIGILCKYYRLELIFFVSPTSSKSRIADILSKAPGCIYLVSSTGVTGIRNSIDLSIHFLSNYIESQTNKLIMLGFGISSTTQVSRILQSKSSINGIVIGSAFTNILSCCSDGTKANIIKKLGDFCEQMKLAMF
uniref:Tryptophan synthase alpha chain n=1 Tax=Periphykon beckeri TaxID=2006982 RepID=A0A1Z1M2Q7_9FLOR|nr:Tryptophan synthase alpha subunit [Periphykon beckeri]ARW60349.1 Tryptophan synthase alpha subunit [Periphykon beckeri]